MGKEQTKKRNRNRKLILEALHFHGPQQRSRLNQLYGIRKSSITSIVAELLEQGLILEEEPEKAQSKIALNHKNYATITSITEGHITTGKVTTAGKILCLEKTATTQEMSPQQLSSLIGEKIQLLTRNNEGTPLGWGIALPGIINPIEGKVIRTNYPNRWNNISLKEMLQPYFEGTITIDNDVRAQLWDSAWFEKTLINTENILYIGILQGIASAMIVHGKMLLGGNFAAGEIGHIRVGHSELRCSCGKFDCLEAYSSIPAIIKEILNTKPALSKENKLSTAADIAILGEQDPVVKNVLDRVAKILARSVASLVGATNPEVIILGSEDKKFSKMLQPYLEHHLYSELIGTEVPHVKINIAHDAVSATIRGIGGLTFKESFRKAD